MTAPLDWARDSAGWPHREQSRLVDAGGLHWHVQQWGPTGAPVLLLLHGTGASTHSWRTLAPRLAAEWCVLAPDLPGHAFTQTPPAATLTLPGMARAVAALLAALRLAPRLIVGHSAGAAVAAQMVLDGLAAPRALAGLNAAFLPFGGLAAPLFTPLARLLYSVPAAPRWLARRAADEAVVRRLVAGTGSTLDAEGLAFYARLLRSQAHGRSALGMMAHWDLHSLSRRLPGLGLPLHLLAGGQDRAVPARQARRVQAAVSGSTLRVLPGLGHLAHEEDAAAVLQWLHPIMDAALR